jgi:excisionase family DNA binding protein
MTANPFEAIDTRLTNIEQLLIDIKYRDFETQPAPAKNLHSIQELADFLGCSTVKAQRLKNSGKIRYYQSGRKVIFKPDEILQDLKHK